jgi:RNA polymerase sigma factor (sigma-70 family)
MVNGFANTNTVIRKVMRMEKHDSEVQRLIEENMRLVGYVVHHLCRVPRHLVDDAVAEGYLALCRAARKYNPKMKVNFSTYACVVIARQVFYFVRKSVCREEREREYVERRQEELRRKMEYKGDAGNTVLDVMIRKEANDMTGKVLDARMHGKTVREIAEDLGVGQDYVVRILSRWRKEYIGE